MSMLPDNFQQLNVRYNSCYRKVTTTDVETGEVRSGMFMHDTGIEGQIILADNNIVVALKDGSRGVAKCGNHDTFNFSHGLKIAYSRAMLQHLAKQIEELVQLSITEE